MEGQRRNRILRKKPLISGFLFYVVVIVVFQELSAFATYNR
jgi:hypothetical protein